MSPGGRGSCDFWGEDGGEDLRSESVGFTEPTPGQAHPQRAARPGPISLPSETRIQTLLAHICGAAPLVRFKALSPSLYAPND